MIPVIFGATDLTLIVAEAMVDIGYTPAGFVTVGETILPLLKSEWVTYSHAFYRKPT